MYKGPFRKHYWGWRLFYFHRRNLGIPPPTYTENPTLTPTAYTFNNTPIIWAIYFVLIINILQNLSAPTEDCQNLGRPLINREI